MNTQALATTQTEENSLAVFEPDTLLKLHKIGEMMANGKTTVPRHLQQNPSDCTAIAMQAYQWQMNPFAVAQKTHLVNGTLGYEAQLVVAVINSRAPVRERLKYEWEGNWTSVNGKTDKEDSRACTVSATMNGEAEPRKLRVSMAQVGPRNSPLWEHDPRQQLAYLCAKRWARLHCPDVLLGVYTPDELQEFIPAREQVTPTSSSAIVRDHEHAEDAHIVDDLKPQAATAEPEPEFDEEKEISLAADQINACETLAELKALEIPLSGKFVNHDDAWATVGAMYSKRGKEIKAANAERLRAEDAKKLAEAE